MPPRRGLFRRVIDFFRGGPPEPSRPQEPVPPPSPPLKPLPPVPPAGDSHEQRMRDIFENITGGLYGNDYLEWREVNRSFEGNFTYMDTQEENEELQEQYWDEFLRAYYLTTGEPGYVTRDEFHRDTGVPQSEVDWDLWREIKRGTP